MPASGTPSIFLQVPQHLPSPSRAPTPSSCLIAFPAPPSFLGSIHHWIRCPPACLLLGSLGAPSSPPPTPASSGLGFPNTVVLSPRRGDRGGQQGGGAGQHPTERPGGRKEEEPWTGRPETWGPGLLLVSQMALDQPVSFPGPQCVHLQTEITLGPLGRIVTPSSAGKRCERTRGKVHEVQEEFFLGRSMAVTPSLLLNWTSERYLTAALTGIAQFRDFSLNIPWESGPRLARAAAQSHHARPPPRGPGFNPHTSPQGTAFRGLLLHPPRPHLCWDRPTPRLPAPGLTPPMASASPVFAHPSPFRRQSSTHILPPPVQDSRACQGLETPVT